MAKDLDLKNQLLDRWTKIKQEEDEIHQADPRYLSKRSSLNQQKSAWFSEACGYLISSPEKDHIWCRSWQLMGPLLATLCNYERSPRSPLRPLWGRLSLELRRCAACFRRHHQAKASYRSDYTAASVRPLLDILHRLDQQRIIRHLWEINATIPTSRFLGFRDTEVLTVASEVLQFPRLLDDQDLVAEFQILMKAVVNMDEVVPLDPHQQYPGVYALFLMSNDALHLIGVQLARFTGKLRAKDVEALQPFLEKCIVSLERGVNEEEHGHAWKGINTFLEFSEPLAVEEGLFTCNSSFFSIVSGHIIYGSLGYSYAMNCLRQLFESLGSTIWLRSQVSPSMVVRKLMAQDFCTQNQNRQMEALDIFLPFLQSLEALQDDRHEKHQESILHFLLHRVSLSGDVVDLTRKKACEVALLVIHRGYRMSPPHPPYKCSHIWGPSLVSALDDSSYPSLQKIAFDLIQTIIVSDAAALLASVLDFCAPLSIDYGVFELNDGKEDDVYPSAIEIESENVDCWSQFSAQSQIPSSDYSHWMCIPLLWIYVLVERNPLVFPVCFSKAVFWARSWFSVVEPESCAELEVSVKEWLSSEVKEISAAFVWKYVVGHDGGMESKNSIRTSTMCIPLVRTFKRLTAHYLIRMEQEQLQKQWIWEPGIGGSLILLLLDPNDDVRRVARYMLNHFSNKRGLACGLLFLCSDKSSLSAISLGLRHALKFVQLYSDLLHFWSLHNLFFILRKVLKEGYQPTAASGNSSVDLSIVDFPAPSEHPEQMNVVPISIQGNYLSNVDFRSWKRFCFLISKIAWPCVKKCLMAGKSSFIHKDSQLTCVRILEILPVIVDMLTSSSVAMVESAFNDFNWLFDLMDWGNSPVKFIVRDWKQAFISSLDFLSRASTHKSTATIRAIRDLISQDHVAMDLLAERVSYLVVSLVKEASNAHPISLGSGDALNGDPPLSSENTNVIVAQNGEMENELRDHARPTNNQSSPQNLVDKETSPILNRGLSQGTPVTKEETIPSQNETSDSSNLSSKTTATTLKKRIRYAFAMRVPAKKSKTMS